MTKYNKQYYEANKDKYREANRRYNTKKKNRVHVVVSSTPKDSGFVVVEEVQQ